MHKKVKILILIVALFFSCQAFSQTNADSTIRSTSIEIGTTGHLFFPEWQFSYNNIFKNFYTYAPDYYIKFFPNFSIQITRNLGNKSFSIGYSINVADLSNKQYAVNKYYLNCFYASYKFNPIFKNKFIMLNPQITLSYSKSSSSKYKLFFGDTPIKVYKESMEIGGGMQAKIPIFNNIYFNNTFDLLYHTYVPKLYLRHMITIGCTF